MKKNKKILVFLLIFCICALPLASCGESEGGGISVVTTIFAPYDFARAIGGEGVSVKILLSPGADSHSYDPSPKDMLAISKCDVFIYVGGASDAWVEEILASAENATMKVIKLMDHTEGLLCSDHDHEHGDGHSHDHGEYDEHVWTSPRNAALACEAIAAALCEADVENAGVYETNLAAYKAELAALDAEFKSIVENGARKELVFGDRFPLIYFTEAYGLAYSSAFPGCAGDTEPSALAVAELINKVKEENIPAVFCLGLSADNIANTICEATGARKLTFHSCENVSKDDFAAGETYVSLMKKNANALREALA